MVGKGQALLQTSRVAGDSRKVGTHMTVTQVTAEPSYYSTPFNRGWGSPMHWAYRMRQIALSLSSDVCSMQVVVTTVVERLQLH